MELFCFICAFKIKFLKISNFVFEKNALEFRYFVQR